MAAHRYSLFATLLLLALPLLATADDSYPELKHNPFDRPAEPAARNFATPAAERQAQAISEDPFLRAVLVAGERSVVNLGGVTLEIGDSVDGYRLLAVDESSATFRKDGKNVVFFLYQSDEADEQ